MKEPYEQIARIRTRADLAAFIEALRDDLRAHPDRWENPDLDLFLRALAAWTEDMHGSYRNRGLDVPQDPTWQTFAEMLYSAHMYE